MQSSEPFDQDYRLRARFAMSAGLLILFYHLLSSTLLTGMEQPPFLFADKDFVYRLFVQSGIPQLVSANPFVSLVFDIDLLILPVLFMITLNRTYVVFLSLFLIFYFLTFNSVTGHHYHALVGLIVITIPFWFKKEGKFYLAWDAARYYFLYVFTSAALWKILRGSAFYQDQLSDILKAQQIDLLLQNPGSLHAVVVRYLIANPSVSHTVLLVNVALQLCFLIGFFTKRFDLVLFWLAIIFCAANAFVMNIISVELLILNLTLLDWKKVRALLQRSKLIKQQV